MNIRQLNTVLVPHKTHTPGTSGDATVTRVTGHLQATNMLTVMKRYSLAQLYRLKKGNGYPEGSVCEKLKSLGIFHARSKNKNRPKHIPTIVTTRRNSKPLAPKPYKHFEVPRVWYNLPTMLLSNVTSLPNKLEEVTITARSDNCGVIAITEAWQLNPQVATIPDFTLFHHLRVDRRGGGVAVYCHNTLRPTQLSTDIPDGVEAVWVRASPSKAPRGAASIIYCVLYSPPRNPSQQQLLQHLIHTSDEMRTKYPSAKLVICGDFNDIDTKDLQQHLHLNQVVDFPTHGHKTLDLILTDLGDLYLPPVPLPGFGRSNHITALWSPAPSINQQAEKATVKTFRPITDSGVRGFGQWITHHPWTEVTEAEDVEDKWNNYHRVTTQAFHRFFPEKSVQLHPKDAPWITARIKRLMKQRNNAYKCNDMATYRALRNKVIREIKTAKKSHYPTKVHHLKHSNISNWYKQIKTLTGLSKQTPPIIPCVDKLSNQEAAEEINTHFAAICQRLPPLDTSRLTAYLPSPHPPTQVEEFEVAKCLQHLRTKRSISPIDLPVKLYKEFSPELSKPLCSIINASLQQARCPSAWKISYVSPIPKSSQPKSLNELRPIAITPIPSLICESFVFNWAYADIAPHIDPQQFGNIKSTSTTHCLISLLDYIYRCLEKRKTAVTLTFVDFTKAFDLVNHTIIIEKAIKLGMRASLVQWLSDFLSKRQQAVRFRSATSTPQALTCGVPQGTKMGPLCFLTLINDSLGDINLRWKFVDDSTIAADINRTNPDFNQLQYTINKLQLCTIANDGTINTTKIVEMHNNLEPDKTT